MVKVYCLGSEFDKDGLALKYVGKKFENFTFVAFDGSYEENMIVMDVVKGVNKVQLLELDAFLARQSISAHDFDAGMELKLRKEVGDIKEVKVVCLPFGANLDEDELCSVLGNI